MDNEMKKAFEKHLTQLNRCHLDGTKVKPMPAEERQCFAREQKQMTERNARVLKANGRLRPYRKVSIDGRRTVYYTYDYARFIQSKQQYYLEECREHRRAVVKGKKIVRDERLHTPKVGPWEKEPLEADPGERAPLQRSAYDRLEAVKYAERWWNDYHPEYHQFTDNCTNFISQCLKAGGALMHGAPDREKGWWYRQDDWSYSWAVAHSMRWYLSGSRTGLTATEVERASDLQPGDIICYDFEGDGNWDHTTIVVSKDGNREPLVNAQTENSRNRYWRYEDSTAWTPNIAYKFFQIND
ncbi:amidase domain-containing protein [Natribacillus halophilus]|uniref:Putative amidase domain-containing protein n=1 Tax=Natribacillus halophilus TaxID=549003 RepID=A0A1G8NT66_9BACI|nr:amidase domain-containing protein [Natribacillus halophilus]SDI83393.1 Putative amidase domain-containing protein [Natribacillus halophilus]